MSEGKKPFVITDRRRFTTEGDVRPDAPPPSDRHRDDSPSQPSVEPSSASPSPQTAGPVPVATADIPETDPTLGDYPAPTAEQTEQSRRAYQQTADRLDTAIRASNPGMDHPPAANFEQLVQSLYMTAIVQLGGATAEGQQPQIDLLGARASIDLLGVLSEKSTGNLSPDEEKYLASALFELRMAFLEVTQALARSASSRAAAADPALPFSPGSSPGPVGVKR